jgi:hypothetical protein
MVRIKKINFFHPDHPNILLFFFASMPDRFFIRVVCILIVQIAKVDVNKFVYC